MGRLATEETAVRAIVDKNILQFFQHELPQARCRLVACGPETFVGRFRAKRTWLDLLPARPGRG
jgi:hypothetical protein